MPICDHGMHRGNDMWFTQWIIKWSSNLVLSDQMFGRSAIRKMVLRSHIRPQNLLSKFSCWLYDEYVVCELNLWSYIGLRNDPRY